jgi:hypothetical protein
MSPHPHGLGDLSGRIYVVTGGNAGMSASPRPFLFQGLINGIAVVITALSTLQNIMPRFISAAAPPQKAILQ